MSDLVPYSLIEEVVSFRDRTVEAYEEAFELMSRGMEKMKEAHALRDSACGGIGAASAYYVSSGITEVDAFQEAVKDRNFELLTVTARKIADNKIWHSVIARTDLDALMDKTARDELAKQMEYVPESKPSNPGAMIDEQEIAKGLPPITVETINATLDEFESNLQEIFQRGVATAFSTLDRRFKSHDGFKVGTRLILTNAFNGHGDWRTHYGQQDTLLDVERPFLILDGKPPCKPENGIIGQMIKEREGYRGVRRSLHHGAYFKIRVFENGNCHLWFTRKDLVDKVNQILAGYYGAGLGWGKGGHEADPEEVFKGAELRPHAKNFGLFETPDGLADEVIDDGILRDPDSLLILEPSAGRGQLAKRAVRNPDCVKRYGDEPTPRPQHRVVAVEVQQELCDELHKIGTLHKVIHRNFLEMTPNPIYDRVLMNPPFDKGRDIDHVHHAFKFLKPGGRLVAIMSASTEFSQTKKAKAFRAEMQENCNRWEKWFTDLPPRSFPGTNVNTIMVKVWKRCK